MSAEVQESSGKRGKGKQKKMTVRVDFTPMVDMNMLLITFFMLCTTLSKPQTMEISMPSNDKDITEQQKSMVKASQAITLLLGADNMLVTGLYQVAWRLVYIHYVVRKNHIQPTLVGEQEPISEVFRKHGICMTLFLGAVIPVLLTMGPLNKALAGRSEAWEGAMDSVNLLVWLPTLMICIILLLDGRNIVKKFSSWEDFVKKFIPHIANTGGLLFFIFAVSNIITKLGLGDDVVSVLDKMNLSPIVTLIVVYVLVAVVAGPLSSTATLTAVGVVGHAILVGVGFDPLTTAAALLMISSTEGASPPASGALFVACGLTECDPPKIYMPLINWFVAPIVVMGCLVATGILPVP